MLLYLNKNIRSYHSYIYFDDNWLLFIVVEYNMKTIAIPDCNGINIDFLSYNHLMWKRIISTDEEKKHLMILFVQNRCILKKIDLRIFHELSYIAEIGTKYAFLLCIALKITHQKYFCPDLPSSQYPGRVRRPWNL